MSLNHQLSERNGQNGALKKQKKVAFQKNTNRKQFKLPKAKSCCVFIYNVISKEKNNLQI